MHSFRFSMKNGVVHTELVPDEFIYVARSPEDGEPVATIESDEPLGEFERGQLLELTQGSGRVLWITRVLH